MHFSEQEFRISYGSSALTVEVNGLLGGRKAKLANAESGAAKQSVTFDFISAEDMEESVCALDKALAAACSGSMSSEDSRIKARNHGVILSAQLFQRRFAFLLRSLSDEDGSLLAQPCHAESDQSAQQLPGIAYLSKRCLVFLPQRYSMCSCEDSLRKHSQIFRLLRTHVARVFLPSDVGMEIQPAQRQPNQQPDSAPTTEPSNDEENEQSGDSPARLRLWFGSHGDGEDFVAQVLAAVQREIARETDGVEDIDGGTWRAAYLKKSAAELRKDESFRKVVYGDRE